jgi:Ca2+-binding RTX toxin-like protein
VANVENLIGPRYDDVLAGNAATDNRLEGGAGNDTLYVHGGLDALDGGAGIDIVDFTTFGAAVSVSLNASGHEAWTQDLPTLTGGTWRPLADLVSVEILIGTAHDDALYGNSAANQFNGGAGNDLLLGGGGSDRLTGGAGIDRFDYDAIGHGVDAIIDFQSGSGNDALDIKDLLTGHTVNGGNIGDYVQLTSAGGNTTVAVDVNGLTGGSAYVEIAVLQGVTGLVVTDMFNQGNLLVS